MVFKLREFSDDETIRRVWDVEDIKKLISTFAYYEAGNRREEALLKLWVSEPVNKVTASFGRNWGFCEGMESVKNYYVDDNSFGANGTQTMHPLLTKLLCVAEGGNTAQGLWMGIGYDTLPNPDGKLKGKWINERIAVDFIKEQDGWKIWHMFIGTNFAVAAGDDYTKQPISTHLHAYRNGNPSWYMVGEGRTEMTADVADFDQVGEYPERDVFRKALTYEAEVYTALYNDPIAFPQLPVDYRTFEDTTAYNYEGYCRTAGSGQGRVL